MNTTNDQQKTNAFNTCLDIFKYRNYTVTESDIDTCTIKGINPDTNTGVFVIFNNTPKFDTKSVKQIIMTLKNNAINHGIVVYNNNITPVTKNIIDSIQDIKIEIFAVSDLQYNILNHRLQPVFEKLDYYQAESFKKNFGTKIPILKVDNPISKFCGYSKGDIIRVIRKNNYIIYRIVR